MTALYPPFGTPLFQLAGSLQFMLLALPVHVVVGGSCTLLPSNCARKKSVGEFPAPTTVVFVKDPNFATVPKPPPTNTLVPVLVSILPMEPALYAGPFTSKLLAHIIWSSVLSYLTMMPVPLVLSAGM